MTKHVAILLAPGFEEAEAIIILDILTRLQITVTTLACHPEMALMSYHEVSVKADDLLANHQDTLFDAIIIPGGPQGSVHLSTHNMAIDFIRKHDDAGKLVCPICSAAAKVLAPNNLLKGRRYVCSGTLSENVSEGIYIDSPVVKDGNLVSGQGLGAAFDFAFYLAYLLTGDFKRVLKQAEHIHYRSTMSGNYIYQ